MDRLLGGIVARLLGASFVLMSCSGDDALLMEALRELSALSMPRWGDYQEDIKGQIGGGLWPLGRGIR